MWKDFSSFASLQSPNPLLNSQTKPKMREVRSGDCKIAYLNPSDEGVYIRLVKAGAIDKSTEVAWSPSMKRENQGLIFHWKSVAQVCLFPERSLGWGFYSSTSRYSVRDPAPRVSNTSPSLFWGPCKQD
jgi:hypothetical protein